MIDRVWARHLGLATICFGGLGALIYGLMVTVTLAHIEAVSGYVPFDMRPLGYNPQDAAALLDGLSAKGRGYYLSHQIPLDTAYPALLSLTLVSLMRWFGQNMPTHLFVRVGIILSVGAVLCDYVENLGIVAMILRWPDISTSLVYASSVATVAKSVLTTAAVTLVMLIGFFATRHRMRHAALPITRCEWDGRHHRRERCAAERMPPQHMWARGFGPFGNAGSLHATGPKRPNTKVGVGSASLAVRHTARSRRPPRRNTGIARRTV